MLQQKEALTKIILKNAQQNYNPHRKIMLSPFLNQEPPFSKKYSIRPIRNTCERF